MEKRVIKTKLVGKEDVFKILALGEAVQTPVLLLGEPGVGKTQALLDYAAAKYNYNKNLVREKTFVIELDEGTRTSEIKGRVNMQALLEDKKYEIDAPIADAEFVLINEVDKGTSGVRNTLLSVMREKALFYGDTIKKCKWTTFAGSCNVIPEDELENPFWDRFILTQKVERVGSDVMKKICDDHNSVQTLTIDVPSKEDVKNAQYDKKLFNKFLELVYPDVSDRTLYALVDVVKAVKLIYNYDDKEALLNICALVAPSHAAALSSKLETKRENNVSSLIAQLPDVIKAGNDGYTTMFVRNLTTELNELGKMSSYRTKANTLKEQMLSIVNSSQMDNSFVSSLNFTF